MYLPRICAASRRAAAGLLYSAVFHAALILALGLWLLPGESSYHGPALSATLQPADEPQPLERAVVLPAPQSVPSLLASSALGGHDLPAAHVPITVPVLVMMEEPAGGWFGPVEDAELGPSDQLGEGGADPGASSAEFLGTRLEGTSFVFIVDMSGSMRGQRFVRAKNELRRAIASLHTDQSYYVIFFSDNALPMPAPGLVSPTPENLRLLEKWLRRVDCGGDTNPLAALELAIDLAPHAIYMLSDGEFDPRIPKLIARRQPTRPIPIHTIGFVSREGEPMLRELAVDSGGSYRFVP
ncbi:MAG: VWA domain-containing protein [Pirellulales bacterium]|nr:VWA domain-containing protein [Pirellulales bacterium]